MFLKIELFGIYDVIIIVQLKWCIIKIFGGAGVVDGVRGNSKRGLKWGGGGIKESFRKHLEIGCVFVGGQGGNGVTTPTILPPKTLIVHMKGKSMI